MKSKPITKVKLIIVVMIVPVATNSFIFFIYDNQLKKKAELLGPHERILYEKFFVTENRGGAPFREETISDLDFSPTSSDEEPGNHLEKEILEKKIEDTSVLNNYTETKQSKGNSVSSGSGLNFSQTFLEKNKMKLWKQKKSRQFDLESENRKRKKKANSYSLGIDSRPRFQENEDSDDQEISPE